MSKTTLSWALLAAGLTASALLAAPALADFGAPPKPKIDCTKAGNKNKPACQQRTAPSDDEIYYAAYWMARQGQYKEALSALARANDQADPRILTIKGLATRKLGDVEGALPYYLKAIAIDPDNTRTREYLGEAFVAKGNLAGAREQLGEIEKRGGASCEEYVKLAGAIAAFEAGRTPGG